MSNVTSFETPVNNETNYFLYYGLKKPIDSVNYTYFDSDLSEYVTTTIKSFIQDVDGNYIKIPTQIPLTGTLTIKVLT